MRTSLKVCYVLTFLILFSSILAIIRKNFYCTSSECKIVLCILMILNTSTAIMVWVGIEKKISKLLWPMIVMDIITCTFVVTIVLMGEVSYCNTTTIRVVVAIFVCGFCVETVAIIYWAIKGIDAGDES